MADAPLLTSIAFQGGGALGAYATGALEYIYEAEPGFKPACVSGVSIGAFTAAIVASHPENPVPALKAFWEELTVSSPFLPQKVERRLALFGNPAFYRPRLDYFSLASWTYLYDLSPIRATLPRYVDFERIRSGDVGLVVTATNIVSGEIEEFTNESPNTPITLDHLIASGSLPPSYPPLVIGKHTYWDGGLFDNTPLGSLLKRISVEDAAQMRIIVINLFPDQGKVPKTMLDVWDRMIELQFANKTRKDVELARSINALLTVIMELQGLKPGDANPALAHAELEQLAKYKVFENIIPISNSGDEDASGSSDFSPLSIQRRMETGYADAKCKMNEVPPSASEVRGAVRMAAGTPAIATTS
jgi:predicted acylesterase/phospholipase RssA